jgi:2-polyprenyl-3-methyl-5-hydroxy-6-metoxy-1,4-benzoquinol methylase
MSADDRMRWDAFYREKAGDPYPDPDPLLFQFTPPVCALGSARALDLACGLGQNGLWLAAQGYTVDLMDASRVALTRARTEATRRGLRSANFLQVDLDTVKLETSEYDLICIVRFLDRNLVPQIRAAVRPGGRVIYATFNQQLLETRTGFNPDYLLRAGELGGYFGDWQILRNDDSTPFSQLVAIKPG